MALNNKERYCFAGVVMAVSLDHFGRGLDKFMEEVRPVKATIHGCYPGPPCSEVMCHQFLRTSGMDVLLPSCPACGII